MRIEVESRTAGATVEDNFNGAAIRKMGDGYVVSMDLTVKYSEVEALMGTGVMVRCPPSHDGARPEAFFEVRFVDKGVDIDDFYVLDASISRYTLTATLVPRDVWSDAEEVEVVTVPPLPKKSALHVETSS